MAFALMVPNPGDMFPFGHAKQKIERVWIRACNEFSEGLIDREFT
jgi:hypothetical protein